MAHTTRLYYNCTPSKLEDELVLLLSSKNDAQVVEDDEIDGQIQICFHHPYLNQAEGLIYKINIYYPLPEFVIWTEDIPEGLVRALKSLGKVMMKHVITDAIRRIYESVDPEYFHTNGIYGKVRWRFGKSKR
jgi:hypothetical protein